MGKTKTTAIEVREKEYFQWLTEEQYWQEYREKHGRFQTAIIKVETLKKENKKWEK